MPTKGKKRQVSKKSSLDAPAAIPFGSALNTSQQMEEANKVYYFPPLKGEIAGFTANFYTFLFPEYKKYGVTDEEIAEIKADSEYMTFVTNRNNKYDGAASNFLGARDTAWLGDMENPALKLTVTPAQVPEIEKDKIPPSVAPNMYARWKRLVLRLRNHPEMSDTFAKDLGILPRPEPSNSQQDENYKPVLKGKLINGQAQLNCPIKHFKGYEVWASDKETGDFVLIGVSVSRFYMDTRPLPPNASAEQRVYKSRMVGANNQPAGNYSGPVTLVVSRAI